MAGRSTILLISLLLVSCRALQPSHPHDGALYALRTLHADLPDHTRVPAIMAAADQALRARGYTVLTASTTLDEGRIVARPPAPAPFQRAVVHATITASGHRLSITCEPLGDEPASRALLDDILTRLGR